MVSDEVEKVPKSSSYDSKSAGFLFFVTCIAVAAGFGTTVARARKSIPSHLSNHYDEGARLATKALGYGTLISVTSCGFLVFGVMKAFGVNTVCKRLSSRVLYDHKEIMLFFRIIGENKTSHLTQSSLKVSFIQYTLESEVFI